MLDLIIKNGQCYINGKLENKDIAIKDGASIGVGGNALNIPGS